MRVGDRINCTDGPALLDNVEEIEGEVDVVAITFEPDLPVAAFMPPRSSTILTKGQPKLRRGSNRPTVSDALQLAPQPLS